MCAWNTLRHEFGESKFVTEIKIVTTGPGHDLSLGHPYAQSGQWKTWEPLGQDRAGRTLGVVRGRSGGSCDPPYGFRRV